MSPYSSNKDDEIYIDCRPVDIINNDIDIHNDNFKEKHGNSDSIFNSMTSISSNTLSNNVGFQTVIGIVIISIIYGIGGYIFKELPRSIVQDRVNNK